MKIPKIFHQIWLGGEIPAWLTDFSKTWQKYNPDFDYLLWTEKDLEDLDVTRTKAFASKDLRIKSNLIRIEILYRHGGIYVDTDFECLKPIHGLLSGITFFAASEDDIHISTGIVGCTRNHKIIENLLNKVEESYELGERCGVDLFTRYIKSESGAKLANFTEGFQIFSKEYFYPYSSTDLCNAKSVFKADLSKAYAVHHWSSIRHLFGSAYWPSDFKWSALWEHITAEHFRDLENKDLSNFKSSRANFRLAMWDPDTNGRKYLRTLMCNMELWLDLQDFSRLQLITNRNIWNPITITWNGEKVCMDYLQVLVELGYLAGNVSYLTARNFLEIGAGYGRTCHGIIKTHSFLDSYTIVDLEPCLKLSKIYLQEVLTKEEFDKLIFTTPNQLAGKNFDFCISIDSMSEMTVDTVRNYLSTINRTCRNFYLKGPVAKYKDPDFVESDYSSRQRRMAMETGLITDTVDIYDNRAVAEAAEVFVQKHHPGPRWQSVNAEWCPPFSHYWQVIYYKLL